MADFKRKDTGVKAVRAPSVGTLLDSSGEKVPAGSWLVVDDGEERVLTDAEFKAEYEPEAPSAGSSLVPHREPREQHRLAPQPRYAHPPGIMQPGGSYAPGQAPLANVGPLSRIVNGSMDPNVMLPGIEVVDDKTGKVIARRPPLRVETDRRPQIESMEVDAQGNVVSARVKPEEWPPRNERFGG